MKKIKYQFTTVPQINRNLAMFELQVLGDRVQKLDGKITDYRQAWSTGQGFIFTGSLELPDKTNIGLLPGKIEPVSKKKEAKILE